ncbi:MAG: ABC transporter ATP-binding protein [Cumulibacter sp.]
MSEPAIVVDDVSKIFRLYKERNQSLKATVLRRGRAKYQDFWALKDVSFEIPQGSTFGLIGENGSGKSTMLKCIANILTPNSGKITRNGRTAALLELGSGFHPELSGRENVYLNGSILGLSRKEIDKAFDSIVDFSGVEQFIDQPVKNYSSGMFVRLGFSIAIHIEPEILLVDEILAVGDSAFQQKCMEKFRNFRDEGRTVVIVSHAMGTMRDMCDWAVWLKHGEVVEYGETSGLVDDYLADTAADRIHDPSSAAPGEHYGDGMASVTDVRFIDAHGNPTYTVGLGERFSIEIDYSCKAPISRPVFGVALRNAGGTKVWAHNTKDDRVDFANLAGAGSVTLDVDRMMLAPGKYDLSVSLTDWSRQHNHHHIKDVVALDVAPTEKYHEGEGIAVLGAKFRSPAIHSAVAPADSR